MYPYFKTQAKIKYSNDFELLSFGHSEREYLLIDLDGGNVPLSFVANQRREFRKIRHCDWLSPKVEHFRRRGRLVDIP